MIKNKLVWDKWNKNHIKKHQVTVKEVEEAYKNKIFEISSYLGRKIIFGKQKNNRLLTIVISFAKQKEPYVVSARDTSKKERKVLYEKTKTNKTI
jgi:hypothetical protein